MTDNCNCWPELLWRTTAIVFTWIIINWSNVLPKTAIFTNSSSITNNCNCYDQIKFYQQRQLLWPHPVLPIISIVMPWSKFFFWAATALRSQKHPALAPQTCWQLQLLWLMTAIVMTWIDMTVTEIVMTDNCNCYDWQLQLIWPELLWPTTAMRRPCGIFRFKFSNLIIKKEMSDLFPTFFTKYVRTAVGSKSHYLVTIIH